MHSSEDIVVLSGKVGKIGSIGKQYVLNSLPVFYEEFEGLNEADKWRRLTDIAVQHLKKEKILPSFAQEQDYEHHGLSYKPINKVLAEIESMLGLDHTKDDFKIEKVYDNAFDKIIIPDEFRDRIIETVNQLKDKDKIFQEWGLGEKLGNRGRGVNLLFSGESGTGKTYCGEIIAEYLGFEVNLISVATFESKWVGESEKNISELFKSINSAKTVLILDEVDSFLHSRSKTDQIYQNKLVNQFLIELERHNGICIMTTNRPVHLDRALARRIDLVLDFPAPSQEVRSKIWKTLIPAKLPQAKIDFQKLSEININGGLIKNALLSAARYMITNNIDKLTTEILITKAQEERLEQKNLLRGDFS